MTRPHRFWMSGWHRLALKWAGMDPVTRWRPRRRYQQALDRFNEAKPMNSQQKHIFNLYCDGSKVPGSGTIRTGYFDGLHGRPARYISSSLGFAAWKAGKAAAARQTSVPHLVKDVLDDMTGKSVQSARKRPPDRP